MSDNEQGLNEEELDFLSSKTGLTETFIANAGIEPKRLRHLYNVASKADKFSKGNKILCGTIGAAGAATIGAGVVETDAHTLLGPFMMVAGMAVSVIAGATYAAANKIRNSNRKNFDDVKNEIMKVAENKLQPPSAE